MKLKSKIKGFTIAACVTSIAVLTIIAVVAVSIYQISLSSTQRQWDNYLASVSATSVLSCFQNADSMDEFMNNCNFLGLNGVGDSSVKSDIKVAPYETELDLSEEQMISHPFTDIRKYSDGSVIIYNGDEKLVTFKYNVNSSSSTTAAEQKKQFTEDSEDLKDEDKFKATEKNNIGVIKTLSYKFYARNSSETDKGVFPVFCGNNNTTTYNERNPLTLSYYYDANGVLKTKITGTLKGGTDKGKEKSTLHTSTEFEKYLLENSYVLRAISQKAHSSGNRTDVFFEVYRIRGDSSVERVQLEGKDLYYCVKNVSTAWHTDSSNSYEDTWYTNNYDTNIDNAEDKAFNKSGPYVSTNNASSTNGAYKDNNVKVYYSTTYSTDSSTYSPLKADGHDFSQGFEIASFFQMVNFRTTGSTSGATEYNTKIEITTLETTAQDSSAAIELSGFVDKKGNSVSMTMNDTFITYSDTKGHTYKTAATDFDKFLMKNKYVLKLEKTSEANTLSPSQQTGTCKMWFSVYDYSSGEIKAVTKSGKQVYYYISVSYQLKSSDYTQFSSYSGNWYDFDTKYQLVKTIAVKEVSSTSTTSGSVPSGLSGETYRLPYYLLLNISTKSSGKTDTVIKSVDFKPAVKDSPYIEYTLIKYDSRICYSLTKTGEMRVIGILDDSDRHILLYQYRGSDIATPTEELKNTCGFTTVRDGKKKDGESGYKQHCNLTQKLNVTKVVFNNSKRLISLCDDSNYACLSFKYDNDSDYNADKATITTEGKKFYKLYTKVNDNEYRFKMAGVPYISKNGETIQIVLKVDSDTKVVVFSTKTGTIVSERMYYDIDFKNIGEILEGLDIGKKETRCFYVLPRGDKSKIVCYFTVTYSNVIKTDYTDENNTIEPSIKIWLINKSDLPTTAMDLPSTSCYIDYRKG